MVLQSLPIVVGATLEQNGPELELSLLQLRAWVEPYLPAVSFAVGAVFTYSFLGLLPDYLRTFSNTDEKFHVLYSAIELLDHQFIPGGFPTTVSPRIIDDFKDMLLTKDKEIASLRNNLEQEDQELVELLTQKDEEISKYQIALQERDMKISALQVAKTQVNGRPAFSTLGLSYPISAPSNDQTRATRLQEQLKVALAHRAELEGEVALCTKQAEVLKKENSELQKLREEEAKHRNRRSRHRPGPINAQSCVLLKAFRTRINALQAQLLEADVTQQSIIARYDEQVRELEARLPRHDLDATDTQKSVTAQHDKRVRELEAQLSHHELDVANTKEAMASQYDQQIHKLEAQISERDIDAANMKAIISHCDQRVRELESRLSEHDLDAANTRQAITAQYNQRVNDLESHLASTRETIGALENQAKQNQSSLADMTQKFDKRTQRLTYLESQCAKADELYAQYMNLLNMYNNLRRSQAETQHTGEPQGRINSLENELRAARQQIAELLRSKDQLEKTLKDPRKINPLWEIALAEKDKQVEKERSIIQTLRQELDTFRTTGHPSSDFLNAHEALRQERNGLKDKVTRWESKFYAMEVKAVNLQARERTLTQQLERFKK